MTIQETNEQLSMRYLATLDDKDRAAREWQRQAEQWKAMADRQRGELDAARAWIQERQSLCDILSADSATVAGQTLVEALLAVLAARDEALKGVHGG